MISVTILKNGEEYRGFISEGHAGYAEEGYDIICAAVSVLTINAVNSLEELTEDEFQAEQSPDGGYLKLTFTGSVSKEAELLMKSLELGLRSMEESYGNEFLSVKIRDHEDN